MIRSVVTAVLSAVLVLCVGSNANAALLLAIDVNGTQACASDNNVGCTFGTMITDVDPTVGVLSFGPNPIQIGVLAVSGSVQQATVGGPQNILNTSSAQITNTSTGLAVGTFAVSSTDFTPPVSTAFVSGSATWQNAVGSNLTMGWYNDPLNAQGAETSTDTPGTLLFTCTDAVSSIADSTACSAGPIAISDLDPFSMTLSTQFSLTGGATLVNRGQTEIKPLNVPEPATMLLFGIGMLGAGFMRRRK